MIDFDYTLCPDIADAEGIPDPAFVEKDFYVVQLLGLLQNFKIEGYQIIFSGGTCLSKAHKNTFRMSEDIDIKFVSDTPEQQLTQSVLRQLGRDIVAQLQMLVNDSDIFCLSSKPDKRNKGKYITWEISYPTHFEIRLPLRPIIKLEFITTELLDKPDELPIQSIYSKTIQGPVEAQKVLSSSVASIVAEKVVSLLRRTARWVRKYDDDTKYDQRLIRHIYDVYHVVHIDNISSYSHLINQVIQIDQTQFKNDHIEFQKNPYDEFRFAFLHLQKNDVFKNNYEAFLGPMVYHPNPPSWDEVIERFGLILEGLTK